MEAWVQSQFSPCGISGEQSGTETGCSLSTCQYHTLCAAQCSLCGTIQPVSTIPFVLPIQPVSTIPSVLPIQPVSTIPSVLPIADCLAPLGLSVPSPLCCPLQSVWHHSACQNHPICAAHCSLSGTIQPVSTIPSVLPTAVCLATFSLSEQSSLYCPLQSVWHQQCCIILMFGSGLK